MNLPPLISFKLKSTSITTIILTTILVTMIVAIIGYFFLSRPNKNNTQLSACNSIAGYLEHNQKSFGVCGTDICTQNKLSRPLYSCNNGVVTSICVPDTTCHTNPNYTNTQGYLPIYPGITCPDQSLYGCTCSSGPGLDDSIIISSRERCPDRYCYTYDPKNNLCFRATSYFGQECPLHLLFYGTPISCQELATQFTPEELTALEKLVKSSYHVYGDSPQSGSNTKYIAQEDATTNYLPQEGNSTYLPSSPLGKLFYQVAGILPTNNLPTTLVNNLPIPTDDKVLLLGIDPSNPNYTTITSPNADKALGDNTKIIGGAIHPDFKSYRLEYALSSSNEWTAITPDNTESVFNDLLGIWDTTTLIPGTYRLRLVLDISGTTPHTRYVTVSNLIKQ